MIPFLVLYRARIRMQCISEASTANVLPTDTCPCGWLQIEELEESGESTPSSARASQGIVGGFMFRPNTTSEEHEEDEDDDDELDGAAAWQTVLARVSNLLSAPCLSITEAFKHACCAVCAETMSPLMSTWAALLCRGDCITCSRSVRLNTAS